MRIASFCGPIVVVMLICFVTEGNGELEYYKTSRYPGKGLLPESEAERAKVIRHKAPEGGGLARREVRIWPRKGMDVIPVTQDMPLREWTFESDEVANATPWGRRPDKPEGWQKGYHEEYWDTLCSFRTDNIRAGIVQANVRGVLTPPKTGQYIFYYAADDAGGLFLSTDEEPENARPVAYNTEYARRNQFWFRGPEQISRAIKLEEGRKYYFEANFADQGGGCWMTVAWSMVGSGKSFPEVIDGRFFESLDGKKGYAKAEIHEPVNSPTIHPFLEKGKIKAHLIGFRGVGGRNIKRKDGIESGYQLPMVTLRLADGRKRTLPADIFSAADRKFLEPHYDKAWKQVYDATDHETPYSLQRDVDMSKTVAPGEPGMLNAETEHMSWRAGSQSPKGGFSPWINESDPDEGWRYRERTKEWGENNWLLQEYAGHPIYTWRFNRIPLPKYEVTVCGTLLNGYDERFVGGFAGGGSGACGIRDGASGALAHEWGHGAVMGFGGEGGCDTYSAFSLPRPMGAPSFKNAANRTFFGATVGMYGMASFGTLWGDDPNWGHAFHITVPVSRRYERDLNFTLARIMEQRGFVPEGEGIQGFGDLAGEYLARAATLDFELEYAFMDEVYQPTLSIAERIDNDKPLYRILSGQEPEAYGVNIIRLEVEHDAKEITVDFQGLESEGDYSDWRACIIAVGKDGVRRYSHLWNRGMMSLEVRPDDLSHFMTVVATPTALTKETAERTQGFSASGRHAVVYPWQAEIHGAVPGTPAKRIGDMGEIVTRYSKLLTAPRRTQTQTIKKLTTHYKKLQELANIEPTTTKEAQERYFGMLRMTTYQTAMDMLGPGKPHKNGGGFVADTATVSGSAYVGPNAMVLGDSVVTDNAVIEGAAILLGSCHISGNAKVAGGAVLTSKTLGGFGRCWDEVQDVDGTIRQLPLRGGYEEQHPDALWANFAMEGDSGIRLDDYYRSRMRHVNSGFYYPYATSYFNPMGISLHGFIHGQPEYVNIDDRWGLRFNGPAQYAELNPRVADLGAITLALTMRREKATAATILDLGANRDNAMVLSMDKKGRPKFVATVGGKTVVTLHGKTQLPLNEWSKVRVEIDGNVARLFVDGRDEASVKTTFRPADVYLPGMARKNFMGNNRELNSPLEGVLDELVVYYRVNEDFAKLLPPVVNCPIRPSQGALAALERYASFVDDYNFAVDTALHKAKMATKTKATDAEEETANRAPNVQQMHRDYLPTLVSGKEAEQVAALERKIKEMEADIKIQTRIFEAEAREVLPVIAQVEAERKEMIAVYEKEHEISPDVLRTIDREYHTAIDEAKKNNKEYQELLAKRKGIQAEYDPIRAEMDRERKARNPVPPNRSLMRLQRAKDTVDRDIRQLEEDIGKEVKASTPQFMIPDEYRDFQSRLPDASGAIKMYASEKISPWEKTLGEYGVQLTKIREMSSTRFAPDYRGLNGSWPISRVTYDRFYGKSVEVTSADGETQERAKLPETDQPDDVERMLELMPNRWHTKVDWDWRINEEIDGSIEKLPLLRKWLEKTRGPVVRERPAGSKTGQIR